MTAITEPADSTTVFTVDVIDSDDQPAGEWHAFQRDDHAATDNGYAPDQRWFLLNAGSVDGDPFTWEQVCEDTAAIYALGQRLDAEPLA